MGGADGSNCRVGHGYDRHRLDALPPRGRGRPLIVGGVALEHDRGPVAHSDGDALLHAITDALLGGAGLDDLGTLFPDTDPRWDGVASSVFLSEAAGLVCGAGWEIASVDATLLLERPRIGPVRARIIEHVARTLGVEATRVNVKGKSGEGVGPVGEGLAIEAHAVALLVRRG